MRLDHLLSKEEEVRDCITVELSHITGRSAVMARTLEFEQFCDNLTFLVAMRLGVTPVPIPNTMVKT